MKSNERVKELVKVLTQLFNRSEVVDALTILLIDIGRDEILKQVKERAILKAYTADSPIKIDYATRTLTFVEDDIMLTFEEVFERWAEKEYDM